MLQNSLLLLVISFEAGVVQLLTLTKLLNQSIFLL